MRTVTIVLGTIQIIAGLIFLLADPTSISGLIAFGFGSLSLAAVARARKQVERDSELTYTDLTPWSAPAGLM